MVLDPSMVAMKHELANICALLRPHTPHTMSLEPSAVHFLLHAKNICALPSAHRKEKVAWSVAKLSPKTNLHMLRKINFVGKKVDRCQIFGVAEQLGSRQLLGASHSPKSTSTIMGI